MMGGDAWDDEDDVGAPGVEEGGVERGRAEQKGRVNRHINSQRATLLGENTCVGECGLWRCLKEGDGRRTCVGSGAPLGRR